MFIGPYTYLALTSDIQAEVYFLDTKYYAKFLSLGTLGRYAFIPVPPPPIAPPAPTMATKSANDGKTIVFLHPDLGIGGAERLVVDAAVGLQKRGHRIVIFTSHCDPGHCFDEARDGECFASSSSHLVPILGLINGRPLQEPWMSVSVATPSSPPPSSDDSASSAPSFANFT